MTEAPVVLLALEKENAVQAWRDLMGATNPEKAAEGTVRKLYGTNIGRNSSHGSDSDENAAIELAWFFRGSEIA
jgi:nucleoside-diphosphate kinase